MKRQLVMPFIVCASAALFAGGCAKHDLVKQDEMVPAAATTAKATPAKTTEKAQLDKNALAAQSAKAAAKPQGAAKAEVVKAALQKIYFDFDSAALSEKARAGLTKNADLLKKDKARKVRIEGNCDELGSDDYNLALGERRAKAALKYLQTLGVPAASMSTISYGKEKPADPGHSEAARAANRRDEFVFLAK